eukprot:scaffold38137_cov67-Phaeocystis_antarctica.AAC.4
MVVAAGTPSPPRSSRAHSGSGRRTSGSPRRKSCDSPGRSGAAPAKLKPKKWPRRRRQSCAILYGGRHGTLREHHLLPSAAWVALPGPAGPPRSPSGSTGIAHPRPARPCSGRRARSARRRTRAPCWRRRSGWRRWGARAPPLSSSARGARSAARPARAARSAPCCRSARRRGRGAPGCNRRSGTARPLAELPAEHVLLLVAPPRRRGEARPRAAVGDVQRIAQVDGHREQGRVHVVEVHLQRASVGAHPRAHGRGVRRRGLGDEPLLHPELQVVGVGRRSLLEHPEVVTRRVPHAHHVSLAVGEPLRVEVRREGRHRQRLLLLRTDRPPRPARLHRHVVVDDVADVIVGPRVELDRERGHEPAVAERAAAAAERRNLLCGVAELEGEDGLEAVYQPLLLPVPRRTARELVRRREQQLLEAVAVGLPRVLQHVAGGVHVGRRDARHRARAHLVVQKPQGGWGRQHGRASRKV